MRAPPQNNCDHKFRNAHLFCQEDKIPIKLKEDMRLPWKEIADFSEKTLHKSCKGAPLCSRCRRLKARIQEELSAAINEATES